MSEWGGEAKLPKRGYTPEIGEIVWVTAPFVTAWKEGSGVERPRVRIAARVRRRCWDESTGQGRLFRFEVEKLSTKTLMEAHTAQIAPMHALQQLAYCKEAADG